MIERDRIVEIVAAVGAVGAMIATMYWIGTSYGNGGDLGTDGGQLLVAVIAGFVLLLTAVGLGLAYALNDPEDGLDDTDGSNAT